MSVFSTRLGMAVGLAASLFAGTVTSASGNTVNIVDGGITQATLTCTGSLDPSCAGIVGGSLVVTNPGNQVTGGTAGTLDTTFPYLADTYNIGNDSEANVTTALNILAGTSFVTADATRLDVADLNCTSGGESCSFSTSFAWLVLKIGSESAFINNLLANNAIQLAFNAIPGTGSGLSNVTFYGIGDVTTVIPVPAALPLFLTALGGIGFMGWRRRRAEVSA